MRVESRSNKDNLALLEQAPFGMHSAVGVDENLMREGIRPGVVFCLKNIRKGKEAIQVDENYPLAPYFLIYVMDDGLVELNFTQSKKILDLLKRQAFTHASLDDTAVAALKKRTNNNRDMTHYQQLLAVAVDSLAGKSDEKGIESLFSKGGTVLTATSSQGIEDFMVVSYLVLTEEGDLLAGGLND